MWPSTQVYAGNNNQAINTYIAIALTEAGDVFYCDV